MPSTAPPSRTAKIAVCGGVGVGKTTFVGAVSDSDPVRTEAPITVGGVVTGATGTPTGKSTTTVAMDLGRVRVDDDVVLSVLGTPGQERFWFLWHEITHGAVGAVVLVDARRLPDSFGALDYVEAHGIPFVVAVNAFHGEVLLDAAEVADALALGAEVPVLDCDARDAASATRVLAALVEHARGEPPRTRGPS
jgi:uncharacterized protein